MSPNTLNTRIAIHFGLITSPDGKNYIDTNLNLAARLEGATPPGCICISEVLYQIVNDALREYSFEELESEFKGLGQNKYYIVTNPNDDSAGLTKSESRLDFYFSTSAALKKANNLEAVKETLIQGLVDFPDNPEITFQLADTEFRLENNESAILNYDKCIGLNYKVSDSYLYQAFIYRRLSDDEKAVSSALKAIEANPKRYHAMSLIARIRLKEGNYPEVIHWSNEALKHAPGYISPIAYLMIIALMNDDDDFLIELITRIEVSRRSLLLSSTLSNLTNIGQDKYREKLISITKALEFTDIKKVKKLKNSNSPSKRKTKKSAE